MEKELKIFHPICSRKKENIYVLLKLNRKMS